MNAGRAPLTRAIAAVLRGDERSRTLGRERALLGLPWRCPEGVDMLAYSLGYADGVSERACCNSEQAQAERRSQ